MGRRSPVGVDAGRDQHVGVDHPASLADLHRQRVRGQECVRAWSRGRVRKSSTCASSSLAITETCDFDSLVLPRVSTSFSIRRVETPCRCRSPPPWSAPTLLAGSAREASPGSRAPHAVWGSRLPSCRSGCRSPGSGSHCGSWSAPGTARRRRSHRPVVHHARGLNSMLVLRSEQSSAPWERRRSGGVPQVRSSAVCIAA